MSDYFDTHLTTSPVIGIFRGHDADETVRLSRAAWDAGVQLVEVPIQTPEAVASLEAAATAAREVGREVGAGTVLTVDQLDAALAAGATFIVSPGLHVDVVRACQDRGVPILPGVATSTEIAAAIALELEWLKAFPASVLGTDWIRAQHGPFPNARFVATGGISHANAVEFLHAGCEGIAVGSAFGSAESIAQLRAALDAR